MFRAVKVLDGTEIASQEELVARAAQVIAGESPSARIVFDDDRAARRQRLEERRHEVWATRQEKGVDDQIVKAAAEAGRAAQTQIDREARHADDPQGICARLRSPSALDMAKLNRYGTVDPPPKTQSAVAQGEFDIARPVIEHDHGDVETEDVASVLSS